MADVQISLCYKSEQEVKDSAYSTGTKIKSLLALQLTENILQGTPLILAGTTLSKLKACQRGLEVNSLIKIMTPVEWSEPEMCV